MKPILRSSVVAWLMCIVVSPAAAQPVVKPAQTLRVNIAVIVTGEDGKGISDAAITVKGPKGSYPGTTDGDGKASIEVPFVSRGEYRVRVGKPGYEPQEHLVVMVPPFDSKTFAAPPFILKKRGGVLVTFKVTKEGTPQRVREAHIRVRDSINAISDDYYRTTDSEGMALLQLPGPGSYPLFVEQQTFEPYEGKIEIKAGEQTKSVEIALKEKQSEKTIAVTVLGDVKNGRGSTEPVAGASVSGGQDNAVTDKNGKATLRVRPYTVDGSTEMGWAEAVDVTVSASGYKTHTKNVKLQQKRLGGTSSASETFTLERGDDPSSDAAPIKIVVQVSDSIGRVPLADVTVGSFGTLSTNGKGETAIFDSGNPGADVLAKLRNGIPVKVTHTGHKVYDKVIPPDLLGPSNEVRIYSVQLDEDWDPLAKALTSLEERVAETKALVQSVNSKAQAMASLSTKGAAARRRGESLLNEAKAARKAAKQSESGCKEAKDLEKSLLKWGEDAAQSEKTLRSTLDEAIGLSKVCQSKAAADTIRAKHKAAIVLTAELGRLEKQAKLDNETLGRLIESLPDPKPVRQQLQQFVDKLEEEASAAGKDAAAAEIAFADAVKAVDAAKGLEGRREELLKRYDQMRADYHVREYLQVLPPDLRKRLDNLEATLGPKGNDMMLRVTPTVDDSRLKIIKETLSLLEEYKSQAAEIVREYTLATTCDVQPRDHIVSAIGYIVVGATIELAAAADLPAKADACEAKVAGANASPTPVSDEITVPDVSGFSDPGAMKAAAGPDMVGVLVATKQLPPAGTTKLFAYQDPAAGTKAKRGSTLKIFLYQSLTAVPTPTPSPSASIGKDEVVVPDISRVAGSDLSAMKAAAGPDMVGVIVATKASPPPGNTKLFASQDPPANSKAKRGSTLKIFIYQSLAEASATPSPTASASPSPTPRTTPTATPAPAGMPNLVGLTLDQAVSRLPKNMRVYSTEMVVRPPTPEKALTIFAQSPAAGTNVDPKKEVVVYVKLYSESATSGPDGADPFVGVWAGVSIYKSAATEITISKAPEYGEGAYNILVQGHTYSYPAKSDGPRLSHESGIYKISYTRVGDTLVGDWQYTDIKGRLTTGKSILKKK